MSEFMSEREAQIFYAEQRGYASAMDAERKLHEARIEELEAKLAKVIILAGEMAEAIEDRIDICDASMDETAAVKNYRATLAELTGDKP